jgi:hypothetical protein
MNEAHFESALFFFIEGPQKSEDNATTPEVDFQCWRHWAEHHGGRSSPDEVQVRETAAQVQQPVSLYTWRSASSRHATGKNTQMKLAAILSISFIILNSIKPKD